MEWEFILRRGAYILHDVYAQELASGDIACVVLFQVAGQVRCVWQLWISRDGSQHTFEVWSDDDALNWWYGYSSEAALVEEIKAQIFRP